MPELAPTQRIIDVLSAINRKEYQLPSIQRPFVWTQDQTLRLLDSLMCGYPIGSLMVWKPKDKIRCRPFLDKYNDGERLIAYPPTKEDPRAYMVLDGQQRLQSLYLSFYGRYNGEQVYLRIDDVADETEDDLHYRFEYLKDDEVADDQRYIHIRDLAKVDIEDISGFVEGRFPNMDTEQRKKPTRIVSKFVNQFTNKPVLLFQEIHDGLTYNDVLEVFERVNSGGTRLSKSDLLFSTVTLKIPDMEGRFIKIVDDLNENGRHDFNTDFVIKAAFVVFGKGAKYDFKKLADGDFLDKLGKNFDKMEKVITSLRVWLEDKALIKGGRFLRSKLALITLIDYLMMNGKVLGPDEGTESNAMRQYLYMSMFTRLFSRAPDSVLDQIHDILIAAHDNQTGAFPIKELGDLMAHRERKGSYQFREEYLWDLDLVLNIVDGGVKEIPAKRGWSLERDHIFPQNQLRIANISEHVNNVGNFRLLGKSRNISKSDSMPDANTEFFGFTDQAVTTAFDKARTNLTQENYSDFVCKRQILLEQRVVSFLGFGAEVVNENETHSKQGPMKT